jgi:EcsC protein family
MPEADRLEHMDGVPESLWARLRAQPDRAPELIALAAADRFGPQAERWVRSTGPGHSPERIGRIAVKKHVRLARLEGAALGIGGVWTAAPDLVALAWIQSRMVFYVAAAFGFDPKHPMRPAELLAIQGVYPTAVDAREALDGVGKRLAYALVEKSLDRRSNAAIVRRLARYAGRQVAERYAGRLVPLIGAPIGAVYNGAVTGEVGRRALAYYGGQ